MTRRLLFVHAHPDDESSKGSATASRYVDEGAEVVLVTCTGGEAGEVLNPAAGEVPAEEMAFIREAELAAAVGIIGFSDTYQLGYHDSGYHEDPAGVPDGTFARISVDVSGADLAVILRRHRPQVVVTYPPDGGYPHPDHIMTYEVTMRALDIAEDADADIDGEPWRVTKVYACTAFTRERVLSLHEVMLERGMESPFEGWLERVANREEPAHEAARIDVAKWLDRRDDALRAHVTQVDPEGFWFGVPRDLEREVFPWECFLGLRNDLAPGEPPSEPEDDLFAGIDE